MPTYEYACTQCGEHIEVVQTFADGPLTVCPTCEGRLRKVFSPVGVVFKGSGFYKTDSRKASSGDRPKSETSAKTDSKGEAKSESKGEASSESKGEASSGTKDAPRPEQKSNSGSSGSTAAAS